MTARRGLRHVWLPAVQGLGLVLAVAAAWEGATVFFRISPYYLPRLSVILAAMAADPTLIERPLVETELGVRLCRPPKRVIEILPAE